jgi:hypothetical protein
MEAVIIFAAVAFGLACLARFTREALELYTLLQLRSDRKRLLAELEESVGQSGLGLGTH